MFVTRNLINVSVCAALALTMLPAGYTAADEVFESAEEAVSNIGTGWNLGNTLDSYGTWINASAGDYKAYETAWGNPVTTKEMIGSVKAQGFNAIRIPVTWSQHIDGKGKVDAGWMNRVKEVVDYAYNDGLYVILNVHHDTGEGGGDKVSWIFADNSNYDQNKEKFKGLWTQIAGEFKDYGSRLLFEGYNEMIDKGNTWNAPADPASYKAVNDYAQLFVDTVRETGGNNSKRNIIVNTYVSSVDQAVLDNFKMPQDPSAGHLICEVHCYSPWGFTGTSQSVTWTGVHSDFGQEDKNEIDDIMNRLEAFAKKNNVPVIIGEYGAEFKNNVDQIAQYASYFVGKASDKGIKCFYWDNGDFKTEGEGGYAIFNRKSMTWKDQIVKAIVSSSGTSAAPEITEVPETSETTAESEATASTEPTAATEPSSAQTSAAPMPASENGSGGSFPTVTVLLIADTVLVAAAVVLVMIYRAKKKS